MPDKQRPKVWVDANGNAVEPESEAAARILDADDPRAPKARPEPEAEPEPRQRARTPADHAARKR